MGGASPSTVPLHSDDSLHLHRVLSSGRRALGDHKHVRERTRVDALLHLHINTLLASSHILALGQVPRISVLTFH